MHSALSSYQEGFKKDSVSLRPRFEYARLSLGNNDPATAFDVFDKLIVKFPENATYRYYMVRLIMIWAGRRMLCPLLRKRYYYILLTERLE
ncbi:hypothetical protein [uncultured Nonlabens sp.]|uniref:hypothetical protein n=1 Tax=uncultured Nonlabens sp. TaxID=859306 RepID=UPI00262FE356|nr:hypothetical protein [uncultured Nonlabens sp.]